MKDWLTFGCKHLTFSDLALPDRWSHLLYCSSAPRSQLARTHTPSPFLFSLHLPFEFSPQPSKWISALLITYVYKTNIKQRKTTIKPQAFFFCSPAPISTKDFRDLKGVRILPFRKASLSAAELGCLLLHSVWTEGLVTLTVHTAGLGTRLGLWNCWSISYRLRLHRTKFGEFAGVAHRATPCLWLSTLCKGQPGNWQMMREQPGWSIRFQAQALYSHVLRGLQRQMCLTWLPVKATVFSELGGPVLHFMEVLRILEAKNILWGKWTKLVCLQLSSSPLCLAFLPSGYGEEVSGMLVTRSA